MEQPEFSNILRKYLRGQCSKEEQAIVEAWFMQLEDNPEDTRLLNEVQEQLLREKMLNRVKASLSLDKQSPARSFFTNFFRIAATLLIVILIGGTIFILDQKSASPLKIAFATDGNTIITISNSTASVKHHVLSDGSTIDLQPKGTITLPKRFDAQLREVKLIGEAFFNVSKNKSRPFVISANGVMVKVLGTSFNIKAYEGDEEITVAVKTGKVSVSRPEDNSVARNDVVILTPNQEVVYNTIRSNFLKKIVADPQIILAKPILFEMQYDGIPVDKIFQAMEDNYGIDIVYDAATLSTCNLTTSMSEEGFHERIEIICKAIGAHFEVQEATVVIKSTGCSN